MDQLLQHGLNALMLGGTYALLGIGLTLIFGIMKVVNFTHGELYAFGAYMMYALVMLLGVSFFVALPLAIALGVALGALLELVLLRRLRRADIDTTMLVMIGGLGSIPGATLGGFILALVEELGAGYVSSGYRDAMGFLLIIVILLFRPTGLFARKERIG